MSIARQFTAFTKREIDNLFKQAKQALKVNELTILLAPASNSFGRLLLVTPRKIGNAPERNRVRRRLKTIFRNEQLFNRGYDCAIIVRKAAIDASFDQLKKFMLEAFKKSR